MNVYVDLSEVYALERAATKVLGDVPRRLKAACDKGADLEVRTHPYHNRTGNLERSTFAQTVETNGADATVELAARMDYASFVNRLGYSRIDDAALLAERDFAAWIVGANADLGAR